MTQDLSVEAQTAREDIANALVMLESLRPDTPLANQQALDRGCQLLRATLTKLAR
jgi:hypothetical protein